ncbi:MAG TPA: hypothetical protein VN441_10935, partial [Syntrophomonas sp.]|nr:hypothetical protein [Syntrophomonas sp.]
FTIVCALICTVLSLIIDPIIVWLNFYQPLSWQYYYSIPTFLFMVCFCKAITGIVVKRDTACHGQAQDR